MPDLENVDLMQLATFHHEPLDGRLGVAGEERREAAALQQHHHRCVVDVAIDERRVGIGLGGVEHAQHRGRVEAIPVARSRLAETSAGLRGCGGEEARMGRRLVGPAAVEDQADLESVEDRHQAGDVVLVRMGHEHDVDPPLPEGELLAQPTHRQFRIRATVDYHRGA